MARAPIRCCASRNQWKIKWNGQHYPYNGQRDAIRAAVDAAHKAGKSGHDAQVLVQGADSKFRTEWTYGPDPYPPPGLHLTLGHAHGTTRQQVFQRAHQHVHADGLVDVWSSGIGPRDRRITGCLLYTSDAADEL